MPSNPYRKAHKSIILPEFCYSVHYHQCKEFVDLSADKQLNGIQQPRVGDLVVNESYAVSHHYRSCYKTYPPSICDKLLANTTLDDAVLRYRQQLFDNIQRVIDADNATAKVLSEKAKF